MALLFVPGLAVWNSEPASAQLLASLLLPSSETGGTVLHVSQDGDDGFGLGTAQSPFATLNGALRVASPGDVIELSNGVHWIDSPQIVNARATAEEPLIIRSAPGGRATLDASLAHLGGQESVIQIGLAEHVVIENLEVRNSSGRGISLYEAAWITIRDCSVHHIWDRGIGGSGHHVTIEHNEVYEVVLENENEIFPGGGGWAAAVSPWRFGSGEPSTNWSLVGNDVWASWGEGLGINFVVGVRVEANRVRDSYGPNVYVVHSEDVEIVGNHFLATDPRFYRSGLDRPTHGVGLANEPHPDPNAWPSSVSRIVIANNLMTGVGRGMNFWFDPSNDAVDNSYRDVLIAHNVVYESVEHALYFEAVPEGVERPSNVRVVNNVFLPAQADHNLSLQDPEAFDLSHNVWRDLVPYGVGAGNLAASSLATSPFEQASLEAGPDQFRPTQNSILLSAGAPEPTVPFDFQGNVRSEERPTVGLWETPNAEPAPVDEEPSEPVGEEEPAPLPQPLPKPQEPVDREPPAELSDEPEAPTTEVSEPAEDVQGDEGDDSAPPLRRLTGD